ncbi:transposase [Frankia sp. EAN1pec]|uniref:transposase n=1 Tax=Parafrankia sp. (strain EAN1pec) TaxID=298653 RepID=UPI000A02FF4C
MPSTTAHRSTPPPPRATRCAGWPTRVLQLTDEADNLNRRLTTLLTRHTPALLARVGPDTAAALLIAAGDNPQRGLASDASFAALRDVSPIEASSGKTRRHRLNRSGDRQANAALHRIVITRPRCDSRTHQPLRAVDDTEASVSCPKIQQHPVEL